VAVSAQRREQIAAVVEPQLRQSIGELAMLGAIAEENGRLDVELVLPGTDWPQVAVLTEAVRALEPTAQVAVRAMRDEELLALRHNLRARMAADGDDETPRFLTRSSPCRVLGIGSGKGGVGKSSVTVNLAIALAALGHDVGVLDADVYGFSLPKMFGALSDPVVLGDTVLPTLAYGVRCLSMGYFVPDEQPVIWRGPMLHKAVEQLITEAFWGEPDFLLIDMPPGTGDVALTLSEVVPKIEMYVVTTPQPAAQRVAQRSAYAARKLKLAVRGVIENMSFFLGDDGARYELFGAGGGRSLAEALGVPLLAQIPLDPVLRAGGDDGAPIVAAHPERDAAAQFRALADLVVKQGPARVYRQELRLV
jgi:ATP-binding protein involved in chromosome partitioning